MSEIKFFIPGNPVALKRHRTVRAGKFTRTYDPSANDKADFLAMAMNNRPDVPLTGPIEVRLNFVFKRPKNHYNSKGEIKPSAPGVHTSKPDADNLVKFVLDALNGIFWKDDAQVCWLKAYKVYEHGEWTESEPGVNVRIIPVKNN